MAKKDAPPRWDRKMQQRLARGEAAALGELYDRFASLVHGLAHTVLGDERAADHVTRDVFAHVWEHPDAYDPKQGPLRSWVATLTHRLAVQRLRATETAALAEAGQSSTEELERKVRHASVAARADYIVQSMPVPLRAALELAYFQRRDYRQTAADLGVTEDEARRRLRLGLQLLSTAHDAGTAPGAPPGYGVRRERGRTLRGVRQR
ncbi:sigma-70 family RNA polymerase sigma factor [Streptomyces sp. JCM17656]|nr:sigma-70 family RNA polymerase sigma factor [Streptomyces sp. JCM17656]